MSTRNFRLRLLLHFINYTSAIRQLTRSLKSCSLWQITRLRDVLKVFLFLIQAFGGHGTLAIKVLPFSQFPGQSGIFLPYMNNPWRNASRRPIKIRRLSESLFVVRLYILPVHVPSQKFYLEIILSNHLLRTWVHLEALWLSSRSKNLPDFSDVADGFSVRRDLSLSRRGDLFSLEPWATSSVVCFLRHTAGIWPKMSRMTGQALQTNPSNYLTLVTEKVPPMFFQS